MMSDTQMPINDVQEDEAQIRHLIEKRARAVGEADVDTLVSLYVPDARLFEVLPPLVKSGAEVRESTEAWLGFYQGPVGYEVRDLEVSAFADVAFCHYLYRVTGTTTAGDEVEMWVRATSCWRKVDDAWFIVHEHQSVPFDPSSGQALTRLEP